MSSGAAAPNSREIEEARLTSRRIAELDEVPIAGNFDAAHLKAVHGWIYQDLPAAGIADMAPGEFRPRTPAGKDWQKARALETTSGTFHVAYSAMDQEAIARLDKTLQLCEPTAFAGLKTAEFAKRIAEIYTQLDYVHPFVDGNSRTLRSFTPQFAREAGFELDWHKFAAGPAGRDALCVARDMGVIRLAKPHVQHENTMRNIVYTLDRLEGNRELAELVRSVLQPSRALAFAKLPEADALLHFPELKPAYDTLRQAEAHFDQMKIVDPKTRAAAAQEIRAHVQAKLNDGETQNFRKAIAPEVLRGDGLSR